MSTIIERWRCSCSEHHKIHGNIGFRYWLNSSPSPLCVFIEGRPCVRRCFLMRIIALRNCIFQPSVIKSRISRTFLEPMMTALYKSLFSNFSTLLIVPTSVTRCDRCMNVFVNVLFATSCVVSRVTWRSQCLGVLHQCSPLISTVNIQAAYIAATLTNLLCS